jgi:hypothetical protein
MKKKTKKKAKGIKKSITGKKLFSKSSNPIYSSRLDKLSKLSKQNKALEKSKITRQTNIIAKNRPIKSGPIWEEFSNIFHKDYNYMLKVPEQILDYDGNQITPIEYYRVCDSIDLNTSILRNIKSDFMSLFRIDDDENISSKIKTACQKNYDKTPRNNICYCCGKKVLASQNSCDHLIPILTMLSTVRNESIDDNLFFIHSKCNMKKGDMDLYSLFYYAGGSFFTPKNNQNKCRGIIGNYIRKIKFNSEQEIKLKIGRLTAVNKHIQAIKDELDLLTRTGEDNLFIEALQQMNKDSNSGSGPNNLAIIAEGKKSKRKKTRKYKR